MPSKRGVGAGESPWTKAELAGVRRQLEDDRERLEAELSAIESGIAELVRDSGGGAGDDVADAGSKSFEREQEMSLADNARELLFQTQRALLRLDGGAYGSCDQCGGPIGKARLQAFPRVTMCIECKLAQEH